EQQIRGHAEVGGEREDMGFRELSFAAEDGGTELTFAKKTPEIAGGHASIIKESLENVDAISVVGGGEINRLVLLFISPDKIGECQQIVCLARRDFVFIDDAEWIQNLVGGAKLDVVANGFERVDEDEFEVIIPGGCVPKMGSFNSHRGILSRLV